MTELEKVKARVRLLSGALKRIRIDAQLPERKESGTGIVCPCCRLGEIQDRREVWASETGPAERRGGYHCDYCGVEFHQLPRQHSKYQAGGK